MKHYQAVTDRIVAMLEAGTRPWVQSWAGAAGFGRPLRHDGTPYRGANVLNLWAASACRGFTSPYWLTFNRAKELGACVKKGAKSEAAFYVGTVRKSVEAEGGEKDAIIPFLKAYCVFNADEIEGLPAHFYAKASAPSVLDDRARLEAVDAFMEATGARIHHGGSRAFYRPSTDDVHMPEFGAFKDAASYYSTALHELAHWTGAETRLDRTKGKYFGSPDYAFEELVAELAAAFLCADLGISPEPREDHASYIASWLKALKDDNRAIFRAASLAEKASGFLHAFQADGTDAAEAELDEAA